MARYPHEEIEFANIRPCCFLTNSTTENQCRIKTYLYRDSCALILKLLHFLFLSSGFSGEKIVLEAIPSIPKPQHNHKKTQNLESVSPLVASPGSVIEYTRQLKHISRNLKYLEDDHRTSTTFA